MGKKVTRITSSTLGRSPKPNHRIISGASATSGTVWLATKRGISPRSAKGVKCSATEVRKANMTESEKPSTATRSVEVA